MNTGTRTQFGAESTKRDRAVREGLNDRFEDEEDEANPDLANPINHIVSPR